MALDTFLLLEADTQRPVSAARAQDLQERLQRALEQSANVQPGKRGMSRHQKHFQVVPRIVFQTVGGRTQMALVATDRPGLLAAVAQVMLRAEVRVHDARIATFGERVEDFFALTDRRNAPLAPEQQERLLQALLARIGPTHS
jgi:[protein-PII] uridylyltransferase